MSQAYSWYQFWVSSIRAGRWPLWDPYVFSGRSFAGEMQTGAFYPLNLLLALVPFNRSGMFSPQLYNEFLALAHFLAACFMFALIREFGLSRCSALLGAICFSLGGVVAELLWPHLLWSGIWLPVIFFFLMRAMKAENVRTSLRYGWLVGLALGVSILAGGLHIAMMQALVIVTALGFFGFQPQLAELPSGSKTWSRAGLLLAVIALSGFAAGAAQLLCSMEYGLHSVRWIGAPSALPSTEKIPYAYLRDGVAPQGVMMFLLFQAFNGNVGSGEVLNPYMGVFPLLLALIGAWKAWANPWVRYLSGLAAAAFLYSLGSFSLLHGLLYALVPFLWMAREPARFLYLADFALSILAAFGAEILFSRAGESLSWRGLSRILKWVLIGCILVLCVPAIFAQPQIQPWNTVSILLIAASCGLCLYIAHGHNGRAARFVTVALILFDLSAFDWSARNKIDVARTGTNQLDRLLSCRKAMDFVKSQPGLFRVRVWADNVPNIGDAFGVQSTWGASPTMATNYLAFTSHISHANDLLNVRYLIKPAAAAETGAVYQDADWKVYENAQAYPRAWLVHETVVEPVKEKLLKLIETPEIDPHRVALLGAPLEVKLERVATGESEDVRFHAYEANRLSLSVHAQSRALLVLSEMYYPGWYATVSGRPARIYEVDGALRGIVVERGDSGVTLHYAPQPVFAGLLLTGCAFLGMPLLFLLAWGRPR